MCRFETPHHPPPHMAISPFYIFSEPPSLARLFRQYRPIEILDKHKNKLIWQSYFFIFRRLKNNVTCYFYKQHLYKQPSSPAFLSIANLPPFLQGNLDPSPSMIFQKSQSSL